MTQLPIDGGPVYAETDLSAFIAEPWNALSSLAIVFPAVYWGIKLRDRLRDYIFIYGCILLLSTGGVGSTLYHAFRSSSWLLLMDILPAAILTIAIGVYFWFKVVPVWWQVFSIVVPFNIIRFSLFRFMPTEMAVNVGYFISGTMFFLPILIYLSRHNYRHVVDICISILFLVLSLLFRELDQHLHIKQTLPMGSHFLWHVCSGIGAFFLASYLYKLRRYELHYLENKE